MSGALLNSHDPFFNLALEDHLLHKSAEEYFLLYVNDPSVIVGRHQVIYREADIFEAERLNIPVIRRISGGGAVYHDHGNLNFTFIRNAAKGMQVDFALHTKPVIAFLNSIGIHAALSGKSNITTGGLKISGNAEHVSRERVLHHGTLLFNSSLDTMRKVLRKETGLYTTPAVGSVRAEVINISSIHNRYASLNEFASDLLNFVADYIKGLEKFNAGIMESKAAEEVASCRYRTWEWNYGSSPPYAFRNSFETMGSRHLLEMNVREGIIGECSITGSPGTLARRLTGCRHHPPEIQEKLMESGIREPGELIRLFF